MAVLVNVFFDVHCFLVGGGDGIFGSVLCVSIVLNLYDAVII